MAKVFALRWQLPWVLWLLCCLLLLSTVVSEADPRRHNRKKNRGNGASRDRRIHKNKYSSGYNMNTNYKERMRHLQREQTTVLPEFLPDVPRPKMPDPTFMPGERVIQVHMGDVANLPCTVQYLGARQISWQKLGTDHFLSIGTEIWVQDPNLRVKHHMWPAEVSEWDLEFRSASMEDSGVYECQVISTEKLTWTVELDVLEKPPHNPEISIEGKEFVESGQTVYLRCNTTEGDRIPAFVDWFKDGDKIESSRFPSIAVTKFRAKESMTLISELEITNGQSDDSGTFICRSSSGLIASIEVQVLVGRKADSSNVKRGTGTSSTRIQSVSANNKNNNNVGCSIMRWYLPSFFGYLVVLLVSILVPLALT